MSEVIKELTEEQSKQLEKYRDKWIKIGLNTSKIDRAKAESLVGAVYEQGGLPPPKEIKWVKSPTEALEYVENHSSYDGTKRDAFSNFCYGNHDAGWLSFYDYCYEVLGLHEEVEPLRPLIEFSKEVGWYLPFDDVIVISERPEFISLIAEDSVVHKIENSLPEDVILNGKLHCDGGPALRFRDGSCLFYLNGVKVPEEVAVSHSSKIPAKMFAEIKNAEVRREFVRKVGMERILQEVQGRIVDTQGDYELIMFNIGEIVGERPFLKMVNPSIDTIHVEGVHPNCLTVEDALNWRNGTDIRPTVLT